MARKNPVEPRPLKDLEFGLRNQKRKHGRGGSKAIHHDDISEHGKIIIHQIEEFQRLVDLQSQSRDLFLPDLPNKHQVILETEGLSPEDVHSLGMEFVEEREDGVLVTVTEDSKLSKLQEKTQAYIEQKTEKSGKPRYEGQISTITGVRPSVLEDKIGDRLYERLDQLTFEEKITVDIEITGGKTEIGEEYRRSFRKYIISLNSTRQNSIDDSGEYNAAEIISFIDEDYSIHRVRIPVYAIFDLLQNSRAIWITLIDLIPEIEDDIFRLRDITAGSIPPLPLISPDAPRIVIIDSGITSAHPLFGDGNGTQIIDREINFLPEDIEPSDLTADEVQGGHGTAVASVAAYGSLRDSILVQTFSSAPTFWIENAKVMLPESKVKEGGSPSKAVLCPNQFPKELMRRVIQGFHVPKPLNCKIFNLSIGSAPYRLKSPVSSWSEEIDNLTSNYDVLFVVSAGNLNHDEIYRRINDCGDYPKYLLDMRSRLRNPAQSYSAITVGALSESDVIPLLIRDSAIPIAKSNHPAPFTRAGQLSGRIIKPDVVDWGGNYYRDALSRIRECPELSIPVANNEFSTGRLIRFMCGTSIAAPKVAHLCAEIQQENPWASANLIRALLVNSAEWPADLYSEIFTQNPLGATKPEIIESTLRLCGYGIPQPEKSIHANSHCFVFKTEDAFSWTESDKSSSGYYSGKVSFYVVRLDHDDIIANIPSGTKVRVKITLVYNPSVRKSYRKNYQGVELYWDMRRPEQNPEDFQSRWLEEVEKENKQLDADPGGTIDNSEGEKKSSGKIWDWTLKPVLCPNNQKRKGTVISDWFDAFAWELPETIDIAVLGTVAPWLKPSNPVRQNYALVVSIEALNLDIPIYDRIRVKNAIQIKI